MSVERGFVRLLRKGVVLHYAVQEHGVVAKREGGGRIEREGLLVKGGRLRNVAGLRHDGRVLAAEDRVRGLEVIGKRGGKGAQSAVKVRGGLVGAVRKVGEKLGANPELGRVGFPSAQPNPKVLPRSTLGPFCCPLESFRGRSRPSAN